ncbi:MAG: MFS transporter [Candidatus Desulforudis sp.]|nr:MFS transporter [Desulforudis sp.]
MVNLKTLTWEKVAYTAAMFGLGLCSTTVVQWTLFYYAPPVDLGVTVYLGATAVGAAMALGRLVDAWSDPLIGYFSDRTRLRFGRRRPFMAAGIPLFIASFILLWFPPAPLPSLPNLVWVAGLLGLFFISFSLYAVPYLALLPELTRNQGERVLMALVQTLWFACGAGVATLGPPLLVGIVEFPHLPILWAAMAVLSLGLPVVAVKEYSRRSPVPTATSPGQVWRSLRRNRALLTWAFTLFLAWSGLCVIVKLIPFLYTFLDFHLVALPWWAIVLGLCIILAGLLAGYRATIVYGMRVTFLYCLTISGLLVLALAAAGFLWLPGSPPVVFWVLALLVMPTAVLPVALQNAVTAEIAVRHQHLEGVRLEAMLFAVQGLAAKLALATGAISLGFTLDVFGYSPEGPAGVRAGYALSGVFLLAAAFRMRRYPHNQQPSR